MAKPEHNSRARLCLIAGILAVSAAALVMLPPGICVHDSADIQVAAVTLGITHPPGYPLISLVGHVFAKLFPTNPAFGVSVMNWLTGVCVLAITACILRRLRVRTTIVLATIMLLPTAPTFWSLWTVPEVYMPVLLMIVITVWALLQWHNAHRAGWLMLGALALGSAAATRTSMWLYVLPAILAVALHRGGTRRRPSRTQRWLSLTIACVAFIAPLLVSWTYLWYRDAPTTSYNYLSQMARGTESFEPDAFDTESKLNRLIWLVTARQYWDWLEPSPRAMWHRLSRFVAETTTRDLLILFPLMAFAITGATGLWHRRRGTVILLLGVFLTDAMFLTAYTVHDTSEMTLPLIWIMAILAACGMEKTLKRLSRDFETHQRNPVPRVAVGIACAACLACGLLSGNHIRQGRNPWAYPPDLQVKWPALPEGSTICSGWTLYPALKYQQLIEARRDDLRVLVPSKDDPWKDVAKRATGPVYYTRMAERPAGWTLREEHGLWRVLPQSTPSLPCDD